MIRGLERKLRAFLASRGDLSARAIGKRRLRQRAAKVLGVTLPTVATYADLKLLRALRPSTPPSPRKGEGFYNSPQWQDLRYRALKLHGGRCQCCGARPTRDNPLHVDHIKPRSKYPALELSLENLQVLCKSCNLGKRAWDETDWRATEARV